MRKTLLDLRATITKIAEENNADWGVGLDIAMQIAKDFIQGNTSQYYANDITPSELEEIIKYVKETDRDLIHQDRKAYNEFFIDKWRNDGWGSSKTE